MIYHLYIHMDIYSLPLINARILQDWERKVHELCEQAPLDNENNQQVKHIRSYIASQWARVLHLASQHGSKSTLVNDRVNFIENSLKKIIQEYGQVIPFAPDPNFAPFADIGECIVVAANSTTSSPSSSEKDNSPDSGDGISFDMKFLRCKDDVWTVLFVIWFEFGKYVLKVYGVTGKVKVTNSSIY